MTLASGVRLGPYEILSPLGAGGMGEVYRAKDTRLGRDVAIKVLQEKFFEDEDRRTRFERPARWPPSIMPPSRPSTPSRKSPDDISSCKSTAVLSTSCTS